ncbi:MAG: ABC transporter ATP-binding protein [Caldimonas sp.]
MSPIPIEVHGASHRAAAPVGLGVRIEGVVKKHGTTTVLHGVDLAIEPGEFFVLLGPAGSGKTTTLRILAGLESVSAGRVLMDGADVTTHEPGERDVAMVFQSYALYPHMTVAQNIGFPLKMVGTAVAEIERAVAEAAAKVGIGHLLKRTPGQLSGGQQQRCALARAIVRQPRLFLLDEPLSNLDAKLRLETRLELHALQRTLGATTVYVTHDQEEAMTLADRIAVFMEGRIVQIGTPREVFATPQTIAVAGFIGTPPMNLLPGRWQGNAVTVEGHALPVAAASAAAREVMLGVRPNDLRIVASGLPAQVERVEDLGDSSIVSFKAAGKLLKLKSDRLPPVREGDAVQLGFDPAGAHLFDPHSGVRL